MSELAIHRDAQRGAGYVLKAKMVVPRDQGEVFDYFANPANLQELTPPWLRFRIATPGPIAMREGTLIDYRLRVRGVPIGWQTLISSWEPTVRFVDEALRSPYRYWRHEHLFEACDEGTRVLDTVCYDVPGGRVVHGLFVRRDLLSIFAYRQEVLRQRFAVTTAPPAEAPA